MKVIFYGALRFTSFTLTLVLFGNVQAKALQEEVSPQATIGTDSGQVIMLGGSVELTGSYQGLNSNTSRYQWRFIKKPEGSSSSLSTPAPSMPSFVLDAEGIYVVELVVADDELVTPPAYRIFSAVMPAGNSVLAEESINTSRLCALTLALLGCSEVGRTFNATAGEYSLNVINEGADEVEIHLNGVKVELPYFLSGSQKISKRLNFKAANELKVRVSGGLESSVKVSVVSGTLPQDHNTAPTVADVTLTHSRSFLNVRGNIAVVDPDTGQQYTSEVLSPFDHGIASMQGRSFQFSFWDVSRGDRLFHILTYDDGAPAKGVISRVRVSVNYNSKPRFAGPAVIFVDIDANDISFNLGLGEDREDKHLSYSLLTLPPLGTLSCTQRGAIYSCRYVVPSDFRQETRFRYVVSDGSRNSSSLATLKPFAPNSRATMLAGGRYHFCSLFDRGNVRCWGYLSGLGPPGRSNRTIGDDELPIELGDVFFEFPAVQIAAGDSFACVLLSVGEVRCWGSTQYRKTGGATLSRSMDMGTSLKVKQIALGDLHACALFVNGQVKCWGLSGSGRLGLGSVASAGAPLYPTELPFLDLGGRAVQLTLGVHHSCALMAGGRVRCWGKLSQRSEYIGDDEHPSAIPFMALEGSVQRLFGSPGPSDDSFFCCH